MNFENLLIDSDEYVDDYDFYGIDIESDVYNDILDHTAVTEALMIYDPVFASANEHLTNLIRNTANSMYDIDFIATESDNKEKGGKFVSKIKGAIAKMCATIRKKAYNWSQKAYKKGHKKWGKMWEAVAKTAKKWEQKLSGAKTTEEVNKIGEDAKKLAKETEKMEQTCTKEISTTKTLEDGTEVTTNSDGNTSYYDPDYAEKYKARQKELEEKRKREKEVEQARREGYIQGNIDGRKPNAQKTASGVMNKGGKVTPASDIYKQTYGVSESYIEIDSDALFEAMEAASAGYIDYIFEDELDLIATEGVKAVAGKLMDKLRRGIAKAAFSVYKKASNAANKAKPGSRKRSLLEKIAKKAKAIYDKFSAKIAAHNPTADDDRRDGVNMTQEEAEKAQQDVQKLQDDLELVEKEEAFDNGDPDATDDPYTTATGSFTTLTTLNTEYDEACVGYESAMLDISMAMEGLFGPKSSEKLLSKVQKKARSLKTVGMCDDYLSRLSMEEKKFNASIAALQQASKTYQENGDKRAFRDACKPVLKELNKTCKILKIRDISADPKNITQDEIKKLRDFIVGAKKIIQERKASLSNASESFVGSYDFGLESLFDFDDDDDLYDFASESFNDDEYLLDAVDAALEGVLIGANTKRAFRYRFGEKSKEAKAMVRGAKRAYKEHRWDEAIGLYKQAKKCYQELLAQAKKLPKYESYYGQMSGMPKIDLTNWCIEQISECDNKIEKIQIKKKKEGLA